MRADEFLVERFLEKEAKIAELEDEIKQLEEDLDVLAEENAEYARFVEIISKYARETGYSFEIFIKNYENGAEEVIDFVKNIIGFSGKKDEKISEEE